jgi:predicted dehydrogenase
MHETEITDELRVIIDDGASTTAYFTFSSQMRPVLRQFRIYGPKNALVMDHDHQTVIKLRGARYKSYLEKFIPPYDLSAQYLWSSLTNMYLFLKSDFHMKDGMKVLIEAFYQSILRDTPLPIPYREIILTARIMDSIFAQINSRRPAHATIV